MRIGKRKRCASNENLNLCSYMEYHEENSNNSTTLMALNLNELSQKIINNGYGHSNHYLSKKSKLNDLKQTKLIDISNSNGLLSELSLINGFNKETITNLVSINKSSYFSLTPASSTTSLNNLNLNEPLRDTKSKKVFDSSKTQTETSSSASSIKNKAKRGRPPKLAKSKANKKVDLSKIDKYLIEKENDEITNAKLKTTNSKSNLIKTKLILNQKNELETETETDNNNLNKEENLKQKQDNLLSDLNKFYDNYYKLKNEQYTQETPLPELTWANNQDVWNKMKKSDYKFSKDAGYLRKHLGIEPQMRAILLDWLVEISYAYRLHRETFHLCVEYMDRFMSICKQQMRIDRLQLIGLTCLYLAAKAEEIYPPKLADFASHMESYSSDNEELMKKFELFLLKTLNWQISPMTANTWLMSYIQIACLNYKSLIRNFLNESQQELENSQLTEFDLLNQDLKIYSTDLLLPLNIYKNSESNLNINENDIKDFYLKTYMQAITLVDVCLFDIEGLKFDYSVLAASALFHVLVKQDVNSAKNRLVVEIVEKSTGFKLFELDSCIKWMYSYSYACKEILSDRMSLVKKFSNIDEDDCHNIQLYHENLELLKEAQLKKTLNKNKFYFTNPLLLTPPESHRKFESFNSSSLNLTINEDKNL